MIVTKKIQKKVTKVYFSILNSLIFFPAIIIISFLIGSLLLLAHERNISDQFFQNQFSYLYLQDVETARIILSTFIASILSLMVFSFSMVMVVLSQASTNFTPRLLPQLISDTKRQIILGVYGGTLMHCILVLISLGSEGTSSARGLSTMVASLLGLVCVMLFVVFIQNISSVIRIDVIVKDVFNKTERLIKNESKKKHYTSNPDFEGWTIVKSNRTGYFKGFNTSLLDLNHFDNFTNEIHILPYEYKHIWKGEEVLKVDGGLNKDMKRSLLRAMIITENRFQGDSSTSGLIKLTEVVVKAISPAKNDPGTAIDVLHKLGRLLAPALQLPLKAYVEFPKLNGSIIQTNIGTDELMRLVIRPIRNYSKSDTFVIVELIETLNHLVNNPNIGKERLEGLQDELKAIIEDIKVYTKNDVDKNRLLDLVDTTIKTD